MHAHSLTASARIRDLFALLAMACGGWVCEKTGRPFNRVFTAFTKQVHQRHSDGQLFLQPFEDVETWTAVDRKNNREKRKQYSGQDERQLGGTTILLCLTVVPFRCRWGGERDPDYMSCPCRKRMGRKRTAVEGCPLWEFEKANGRIEGCSRL